MGRPAAILRRSRRQLLEKGDCPAMLSRNAEFNAVNRGVYIADNLDFLRALNTASVDLVCIDPPFAKNDTFTGDKLRPPLRADERENEERLLSLWGLATPEQADDAGIAWPDDPKARGGYKDTWAWDEDIHEDWVNGIKATHPAVNLLIEATREIHGDSIAAYLCFMAIRLFEIHRILKPTGSLYLHCDHTASAYLRQLLDGVFGRDNFRNEIIWAYQRWTGATKTFQRMHDTIYFYAKEAQEQYFYQLSEPYSAKSQHKGRRHSTFTAGGKIQQNYTDDTSRQKAMRDIWEMSYLNSQAKERTGYPTQKPAALAERIIAASCPPDGVVLDCFAGCAYTAVAAEKLGRRWTACDINLRAWTVFKRQFNKGGKLPLLTCNDRTTGQQVLGSAPTVTLHGPAELPRRTTTAEVEIKPLRTTAQRDKTARQYKRASTLLSDPEMKEILLRLSDGKAWCCGYESKNADFSLNLRDYELDHIIPKSRGGDDDIINRAPLCPTHNGLKSDHNWTLQELRIEVAYRQELKPGMTPAGLQRLDVALEYAQRERQKAYERKHGKRMDI